MFICVGRCPGTERMTSCQADSTGVTWYAKLVAANDSAQANPKYLCVTWRGAKPNAPHIPGSVRWRWSITDEGEWVRCTQGCCEVLL